MLRYIFKRFLLMIPTLIGITLVTFVIIQLAPGDPTDVFSGGMMTQYSAEAQQKFLEAYGFDKPVPVQYGVWLSKFVRMDFGNSLMDGRPVVEVIGEKLPVTLYLNLISITIIFLIAVPVGVKSAVQRGKVFDKASAVILFVLYSLFVPVVAIGLISLFSVKLGILPLYGITSDYFDSLPFFAKVWDLIWHSFLPIIVMSYGGLAFLARMARGSVLETLNMEYVTTARAKGLPEKLVIRRHALRNALIPLVTLFGSILPGLIGGSVIIERIFNIDGMGNLFFLSVASRDLFMIMGLSSISAVMTLVAILLSDILYAAVDPRIQFE